MLTSADILCSCPPHPWRSAPKIDTPVIPALENVQFGFFSGLSSYGLQEMDEQMDRSCNAA